jgi:hypothetical protein
MGAPASGSLAALVAACCLTVGVGSAAAAVRSYATTFDPNYAIPTFGSTPTPLPDIPFTVSVNDTTGTLTVSEGGADSQYADGWQQDSYILSGPGSTPQGSITWDDESAIGGTSGLGPLTVAGISGGLRPTLSVTGGVITATYSSPLLVGINWTYVSVSGDSGPDGNASEVSPNLAGYMNGYVPRIAISAPLSGWTRLGKAVNLSVNASLQNVAADDGSSEHNDNGSAITSGPQLFFEDEGAISVSGLPPGVHFDASEPSDQYIYGTPSKAGAYRVTVYATAKVNTGRQGVSSSDSFLWEVIPPPTQVLRGDFDLPATRPKAIVYTGDGSGWLAGAARRFAGLRWTVWSSAVARATGANWLDDCVPNCAQGRFTGYPVKILLSRPEFLRGHEVFKRLTGTYTKALPPHTHERSFTWTVGLVSGHYVWND